MKTFAPEPIFRGTQILAVLLLLNILLGLYTLWTPTLTTSNSVSIQQTAPMVVPDVMTFSYEHIPLESDRPFIAEDILTFPILPHPGGYDIHVSTISTPKTSVLWQLKATNESSMILASGICKDNCFESRFMFHPDRTRQAQLVFRTVATESVVAGLYVTVFPRGVEHVPVRHRLMNGKLALDRPLLFKVPLEAGIVSLLPYGTVEDLPSRMIRYEVFVDVRGDVVLRSGYLDMPAGVVVQGNGQQGVYVRYSIDAEHYKRENKYAGDEFRAHVGVTTTQLSAN